MKTHTRVLVIGGGVVGCSVLYHLTKLGWSDVMAAASWADAVFIDAATGHTERVLFVVERLRSEFSTPVVAGNVDVIAQHGVKLCNFG